MVDTTLNYLIAQTRQNVSLLQELEQVSRQDAELILSKLPIPQNITTSCNTFRARAKYGYNEDGREPKDLSFNAGDVVEVLEESNWDWWHGRHRGREGLFPSSYVERLTNDAASRPAPPPPSPSYSQVPSHMAPPPFSPYPAPPSQPYYGPPPQHPAPYPMYTGPPPPPPGPIMQGNQPENKKSGPFGGGGLKNTLAHSAVGGAGFGAGSAIAGNIVNQLF